MKCPQCNTEYVCPCKHCAETFSKGKVAWIGYDDDTEACPKCGLRKHLDEWLDIEWQQFKNKTI